MRKWTILKRETVLATRWLTVFKDAVHTSRGHIVDDYYVAQKRDVAMVAAFTSDNRLVLIREYKHGCRESVWQLPAGEIDDDASAVETAARELAEEAGITAQSYELLGSWYVSPPWLTTKVFIFLARDAMISTAQNLEATEEIEVKIVEFDEVLEMVIRNEIKDAHSSLAVLWVAHHLTLEKPK